MMRRDMSAVAIGIALVAFGVVVGGESLGWWDVNVFFEGWWTLFLIVPAVVSIIGSGPNVGNLILLAVGVALLVDQRGYLGPVSVWSLLVPVVLILIGASIIWKGVLGPRLPRETRVNTVKPGQNVTAVFSGSKAVYTGLSFKGVTTLALFGGVEIDLRGAEISEDAVIDATTIFGGTDVVVSAGAKVELTSVGIFGGSENHAPAPIDAAGPTIYVRSTAVFGGLEVKVK